MNIHESVTDQQDGTSRVYEDEVSNIINGGGWRLRPPSPESSDQNDYDDNHLMIASRKASTQSISAAIAAAAFVKKKPDLLLGNIMKLEELIRQTSKEENPAPNYNRLLCSENKVEKFRRL